MDDWPAHLREVAPELVVEGSGLYPVIEGLRLSLPILPAPAAAAVVATLRQARRLLEGAPRKGAKAASLPGLWARLLRGAPAQSWLALRLLALGLTAQPDGSFASASGLARIEGEELALTYATEGWVSSHRRGRVEREYLRAPAASLPAEEEAAERLLEALLALPGSLRAPVFYLCERCSGRFEGISFHADLAACHGCAERHLGAIH